MKLIVNADDFGLSEGQNLGTLKAHKLGVVSSATMMVNQMGYPQALEIAKATPSLKMGIHLTLSLGKPILDPSEIPTLVNEKGLLYKIPESRVSTMSIDEVRKEWTAQVELAIKDGLKFDHFDSHHHVHLFPEFFEVCCELAEKYEVAIRVTTSGLTDQHKASIDKHNVKVVDCDIEFYDENVKVEYFENFVEKHKGKEVVELMCHPAYLDDFILANSAYNIQRVKELMVLTDPKTVEILRSQGVEITDFTEM